MNKRNFLSQLALLIAISLASVFYTEAFAQAKTPTDNDVNAIARQLFCPVCENTPLDVCPTEACRDWRELIRTKLAEGWSEDQIKEYFAEQYGARVLAEPPLSGLNWLVYLIPPALIIAGAAFLTKAFIGMKKNAERTEKELEAIPSVTDQDEYSKLIEDEIKKRI